MGWVDRRQAKDEKKNAAHDAKTAQFNAAREAAALNARGHAVRNLTAKDVKNGVLQEMVDAGAVDHSQMGSGEVKVVLKKGFEGKWTEHDKH